jgi:hypothetical protein
LVLCLAFVLCSVILVRRRRDGVTIAMPVAIMGLGVIRGVLLSVTIVLLMGSFRQVARARADDRAAVLEAAIDDAMPYARFGMSFEVPLLLGAWLIDRELRRRQRPRLTPAQPAPGGTHCATHTEVAATLICVRCGRFMCSACGAADGSLCAACTARAATSAPSRS